MMKNIAARIPGFSSLIVFGILVTVSSEAMAAGQVFWDWPSGRQFSEMELEGAALNNHGSLVPGLQATEVGPSGPEVCWRVLPDTDGGFFTGTGHGGEIFYTDKNDQTSTFANLEGAEVFSLFALDDGGLLAGCGPDGHLYRIDRKGESTLLGKVPGGYIWGMTASTDNETIWLATGSPAAVYRYTENDGLQEFLTFPAENTLDLMLDRDGSLLASTQGPGLVYRIDVNDPSSPWLICETSQDEVRQFIRGKDDAVFFLALNSEVEGSNGLDAKTSSLPPIPPSMLSLFGEPLVPGVDKAALFRLEDGNQYSTWWSGDLDLMIVAWSSQWGWLGGGPLSSEGGQSVIHRLLPPAGHHPMAGWAGGDVLDLNIMDPGDGGHQLLVGQAHPGAVQRLGAQGEGKPMAVSPALDAGRAVQWGRLSWTATAGPGKLRWSVRCGNRSVPDDSWTPWTNAWSNSDKKLDLPACRFMQWRVELPRREVGSQQHWAITSVSVSAWQENAEPVIRDFTVENLSDISRGGLIGSNENVTQKFESGLRVEFARKSQMTQNVGPARAAYTRPVRVMTWQGKDPNSDKLVYTLEYRRDGDSHWRTILDETVEHLGSWDTTEVPDGQYDLRLTVSDYLDNPGDLAMQSQKETGPLKVDNSPPEIDGFKVRDIPGGLRVAFKAEDDLSKLGQALLRMPDGQVQRLDPVDRICDSYKEEFSTDIPWPVAGREAGDKPYSLQVEVWDLSGNVASARGEVR